jgi:hypothetical protein
MRRYLQGNNKYPSAVLAFAGQMASGKTTLSTEVAAHLGWPRVSYGDAVRKVAERRALAPTRANLQELGQELVIQGWEQFTNLVLEQVGGWSGATPLVVDGVRHIGAINSLASLGSLPILVCFLEAPFNRAQRMHSKEGPDASRGSPESHPVEQELAQVRSNAHLIINTDLPLEDSLQQVLLLLRDMAA